MSMAVQIHINAADKLRLFQLLADFPRETYRGMGRAGAAIRGKMRKLMRSGGGADGVEKFAPHDPVTSAKYGAGKLGGVLRNSYMIQMYKNGKASTTIGFISKMAGLAKMFQESETRPFEIGEKRFLHRMGVNTVPDTYDRPARDMVEPFAKHYESDFIKWAIRNTEKILEKAGK
jgi:hypothetical protein